MMIALWCEPMEMNNMNKYFAQIGPGLASIIYLQQTNQENLLTIQFSFLPIITNEILDEINLLPNNKASGLYSCPVKLFKLGDTLLCEPLSFLFIKAAETGTYSSKLKIVKIIPVYITENKRNPENYRPISYYHIEAQPRTQAHFTT